MIRSDALTPAGKMCVGAQPAFGGYVADQNEGGPLYAWWQNGKLAAYQMERGKMTWVAVPSPVYADLFPEVAD